MPAKAAERTGRLSIERQRQCTARSDAIIWSPVLYVAVRSERHADLSVTASGIAESIPLLRGLAPPHVDGAYLSCAARLTVPERRAVTSTEAVELPPLARIGHATAEDDGRPRRRLGSRAVDVIPALQPLGDRRGHAVAQVNPRVGRKVAKAEAAAALFVPYLLCRLHELGNMLI